MSRFPFIVLTTLATLVASTSLATAFGTVTQVTVNKLEVEPPRIDVDRPDDPPGPVIEVHKPFPIKLWQPNPPLLAKSAKPEAMMLDCEIRLPGPTTDHLWIVNVGGIDLPAGLEVGFSVPSTDDRGVFRLPRSIKPGNRIELADLLDDALPGADCRARIL